MLIGLGANPAVRARLPAPGQRMGTLIQTTENHHGFRTIADLAAWEATNNPIDNPDSDPAGMLYQHGKYVVADAGGNTVLKVNRRGHIRLLAKFEDRQVRRATVPGPPTRDADPDAGGPNLSRHQGPRRRLLHQRADRVPVPDGCREHLPDRSSHGKRTVYASGLTNVTDLAFHGRTLYAVQISTEGLLDGTDRLRGQGQARRHHAGRPQATLE